GDVRRLLALLGDPDPFLWAAAVGRLARSPDQLAAIGPGADAVRRAGVLLAERASGRPEAVGRIPGFLAEPHEDVRFRAVQWIADEKLGQFRPLVVEALSEPTLNLRMASAL